MSDKPLYEADADYDLQVARPLTVGAFKYLPRNKVVAKGSLLNRIVEEHGADAIRAANRR